MILYLISISVKFVTFYNDLQLKIVENKDLYRTKDDFRFFLQKVLIFNLKYFIFSKYITL